MKINARQHGNHPRHIIARKFISGKEKVIGEKAEKSMKKKIIYTNEPPNVDLDNAKRIKDFLPPPHELVFKEKTIKVTLALTKKALISLRKRLTNTTSNTKK